jgi:uncharacterized protein YjbJ (UPF0337 family)
MMMNRDQLDGNWNQLKGRVKLQWSKLSFDDIELIEGSRQELADKIQETYGFNKDEADKQISIWELKYDSSFS